MGVVCRGRDPLKLSIRLGKKAWDFICWGFSLNTLIRRFSFFYSAAWELFDFMESLRPNQLELA
jgi:hypothetical protein